MLAIIHGQGQRLRDLNPFDSEAMPSRAQAPSPLKAPQPESGYGCVEWFHYPAAPRCARPLLSSRRRVR